MKKFIIRVYTNWCGEDNEYTAIAESEQLLKPIAEDLAYENFSFFGGPGEILEELFPEEEEYTEKMEAEAAEIESEYYGYSIEEWDENIDDDWEWYRLIYDQSKEISQTDGAVIEEIPGKLYEIYAGLAGGFGGARYIETLEFDSLESAESYAYDCVVDIFESHAGHNGIISWAECLAEITSEYDDLSSDQLEQYADQKYAEEMDNWISYHAIEVE